MQVYQNYNLTYHNTFAISCNCSFFVDVTGKTELQAVLQHPQFHWQNSLILGSGSNVLFTQNYAGFVIHNKILGIEIVDETDDAIFLRIGAGENWHDLVMYCIEHHYAGIENLALIPGTVGAAPIQNIGAYGIELESVFHECEAIDLSNGKEKIFVKSECQFGYRDSIFKREYKNRFIITHVTLKLNKKPTFYTEYGEVKKTLAEMGLQKYSIKDIASAVIKIRRSKLPDPKVLPNSGSFFKNPIVSAEKFAKLRETAANIPSYQAADDQVKVPAAWLIEACGFKGKRFGNVGTYEKQALILVNYQGSGKELYEFAQKIQQDVKLRFDILLEPEVRIVGQ